MKRSSMYAAIAAVGMVGLVAFASQAAKQPLFTSMKSAAATSSDASWRALAESRATLSIQRVGADATQISAKSDTLSLGDFGTAYMQYSRQNGNGTTVWYGNLGKGYGIADSLRYKLTGEISDDPNNSVMIVRNGDKLTGTIRAKGQLYSLRPLKSGGHAIVRVNEAKMPADHPAEAYARIFRESIARSRLGARAKNAPVTANATALAANTIRVMVYYTASAASASGDINGLINLAVAETNQGYVNSGVDISMVLAGTYSTTYKESGSFDRDLTRFRSSTDRYMTDVHTNRNTVAADVGVLIINNSSSCGLASDIGSTATTAFAAVHWDCATGYYSFGHEIGHLQSARHDPATDGSTTPYAYGHGYRSPTNAWRTIMAYNCTNAAGCPRINYWSNPANTYGGQAMGTTATSHNQRVLNNTAATVAAFR